MTTLNNLPIGTKLELAKYLPYKDLSSFCQVDKSNLSLCQDETFWRELFKLRNQDEEPRMTIKTIKDFVFYEDLIRKTRPVKLDQEDEGDEQDEEDDEYIELDYRLVVKPHRPSKEIQQGQYNDVKYIIKYLQDKEIQGYLNGNKPIYAILYGELAKERLPDFLNTTIMAYTKEGLVLKYTHLCNGSVPNKEGFIINAIRLGKYFFKEYEVIIEEIRINKGEDYEPSHEEILQGKADHLVEEVLNDESDDHEAVLLVIVNGPPQIY